MAFNLAQFIKKKKHVNYLPSSGNLIKNVAADEAREQERERNLKRIKDAEYRRTMAGRMGTGIATAFRAAGKRGGISRLVYGQTSMQPGQIVGKKKSRGYGRAGRPKGSLDPRYAQYGGVYGYRKFLAHKFRMEKLSALQQANINPQQQALINQYEAQRRARAMDRESQPIPDTTGGVHLKGIFNEIDNAANLVD